MNGDAITIHYEDKGIRILKVVASPYDNNAYIIVCKSTNQSLIIDAPRNMPKVLKEAKGTDIQGIIITHGHYDHVEGFEHVKRNTKIKTFIHNEDSSSLPSPADCYLIDTQEIQLGLNIIRVLHTPGHTAGGISLVMGSHLFSGDTLFPGGPGRTGSPQDFRQILDSISTKLLALPDDTPVYPGHGVDTTIGKARLEYQNFISRKHPEDLFGEIVWSKTQANT